MILERNTAWAARWRAVARGLMVLCYALVGSVALHVPLHANSDDEMEADRPASPVAHKPLVRKRPADKPKGKSKARKRARTDAAGSGAGAAVAATDAAAAMKTGITHDSTEDAAAALLSLRASTDRSAGSTSSGSSPTGGAAAAMDVEQDTASDVGSDAGSEQDFGPPAFSPSADPWSGAVTVEADTATNGTLANAGDAAVAVPPASAISIKTEPGTEPVAGAAALAAPVSIKVEPGTASAATPATTTTTGAGAAALAAPVNIKVEPGTTADAGAAAAAQPAALPFLTPHPGGTVLQLTSPGCDAVITLHSGMTPAERNQCLADAPFPIGDYLSIYAFRQGSDIGELLNAIHTHTKVPAQTQWRFSITPETSDHTTSASFPLTHTLYTYLCNAPTNLGQRVWDLSWARCRFEHPDAFMMLLNLFSTPSIALSSFQKGCHFALPPAGSEQRKQLITRAHQMYAADSPQFIQGPVLHANGFDLQLSDMPCSLRTLHALVPMLQCTVNLSFHDITFAPNEPTLGLREWVCLMVTLRARNLRFDGCTLSPQLLKLLEKPPSSLDSYYAQIAHRFCPEVFSIQHQIGQENHVLVPMNTPRFFLQNTRFPIPTTSWLEQPADSLYNLMARMLYRLLPDAWDLTLTPFPPRPEMAGLLAPALKGSPKARHVVLGLPDVISHDDARGLTDLLRNLLTYTTGGSLALHAPQAFLSPHVTDGWKTLYTLLCSCLLEMQRMDGNTLALSVHGINPPVHLAPLDSVDFRTYLKRLLVNKAWREHLFFTGRLPHKLTLKIARFGNDRHVWSEFNRLLAPFIQKAKLLQLGPHMAGAPMTGMPVASMTMAPAHMAGAQTTNGAGAAAAAAPPVTMPGATAVPGAGAAMVSASTGGAATGGTATAQTAMSTPEDDDVIVIGDGPDAPRAAQSPPVANGGAAAAVAAATDAEDEECDVMVL